MVGQLAAVEASVVDRVVLRVMVSNFQFQAPNPRRDERRRTLKELRMKKVIQEFLARTQADRDALSKGGQTQGAYLFGCAQGS